ncbi:HET-domain-containing protein [Apiospora arundinis]
MLAFTRLQQDRMHNPARNPRYQPEITLNRSPFRITRNLEAALRGLRDDRVGFTNTYLWIDAICIDQTNDVEKAQQVARMAEIYANAEDVACWLSPWDCSRMHGVGEIPIIPDNSIDMRRDRCSMCQLLAGLQNLALANPVCHVPPLDIDCLMRIVQSPWFTRVWTLQECTIHLRGMIQLGCHSIPINSFLDGAFKAWDALDLPCQLPGYRALESMASIRYQRTQLGRGKISGNDYAETIMMLLQASSNRSCSIPQDILYGVFGLMSSFKESPNNLRPNYTKTFERVCHDYAVEIFTHSPYGLELLGFARNELQGDVPSSRRECKVELEQSATVV